MSTTKNSESNQCGSRPAAPLPCQACHRPVEATEIGWVHVDQQGRHLGWLCADRMALAQGPWPLPAQRSSDPLHDPLPATELLPAAPRAAQEYARRQATPTAPPTTVGGPLEKGQS